MKPTSEDVKVAIVLIAFFTFVGVLYAGIVIGVDNTRISINKRLENNGFVLEKVSSISTTFTVNANNVTQLIQIANSSHTKTIYLDENQYLVIENTTVGTIGYAYQISSGWFTWGTNPP